MLTHSIFFSIHEGIVADASTCHHHLKAKHSEWILQLKWIVVTHRAQVILDLINISISKVTNISWPFWHFSLLFHSLKREKTEKF